MGILERVRDLVSANLNDLMDKAENPEKMLKQIIRDIEDSIDAAKAETAKVMAAARHLEKEIDHKAQEVDKWAKRAEGAVDAGEDELARQALERKLAHEKDLTSLSAQLEETRAAVEQMRCSTEPLQAKLAEARAKFTSLSARQSAAKTAQKAQKHIQNLRDPGKVLGKLDHFERRVEDLEARAGAAAELGAAADAVDKEFSMREKSVEIDAELAALKARRAKNK